MSALRETVLLVNALTGSESASPLGRSRNYAVEVEWGAGTSAGSVIVECAPYKDYSGTWSNLTTFTWAAASQVDVWRGSGPMGAIRTRIGTTVVTTDKGVTTRLLEN